MFKHNVRIAPPRRLIDWCVPGLAASILFAQAAKAEPAPVLDIFIGTVAEEQGQLILERCDLGSTRYVLHSAEGAGDLLGQLRALRKGNAHLQAELVASYRSEGEGHGLEVSAIGETKAGANCHLLDAIDAAFSSAAAAQPEPVAATRPAGDAEKTAP